MCDGKIAFNDIKLMQRGQDKELALAVERALQNTNLKIKDLSAVIVSTGPGSFTGIRVGMAFARGLASVLQIPLIGFTTSEILAYAKPEAEAVVIEIKKDAYIIQSFDQGIPQSGLRAVNQDELKTIVQKNKINSIVTHSENVHSFFPSQSNLSVPSPKAMLELGRRYLVKNIEDNAVIRPVYVRSADVTVKN
jgi:tRNA threonylcarbamoyl adenosine modification protein YeaZ